MLTVRNCSNTGLFGHFFAVYNFRQKSPLRVIFFSRKCKFSVDYANPDKFEKIDNYKIIIFEFVALDSHFY